MDEGILEWLHLKNVARAGWVRAGVESPESVAAHSWGMSLLALHLCPFGQAALADVPKSHQLDAWWLRSATSAHAAHVTATISLEMCFVFKL